MTSLKLVFTLTRIRTVTHTDGVLVRLVRCHSLLSIIMMIKLIPGNVFLDHNLHVLRLDRTCTTVCT